MGGQRNIFLKKILLVYYVCEFLHTFKYVSGVHRGYKMMWDSPLSYEYDLVPFVIKQAVSANNLVKSGRKSK